MDVEAARMGETINVSALNTRHLLDTYLMDDVYIYVHIYVYIHL
jgi:hypothetical protein